MFSGPLEKIPILQVYMILGSRLFVSPLNSVTCDLSLAGPFVTACGSLIMESVNNTFTLHPPWTMETLDSMTLDSTINTSCGYLLNKRWFNQRFTPVGRWTDSQSFSTSLHFVISTKFLDKKMDITEKWQRAAA